MTENIEEMSDREVGEAYVECIREADRSNKEIRDTILGTLVDSDPVHLVELLEGGKSEEFIREVVKEFDSRDGGEHREPVKELFEELEE